MNVDPYYQRQKLVSGNINHL